MSLVKAKIDYIKRGPNDELYTPPEAVEMILPFISKNIKTIWECTAIDESQITKILKEKGYNVISSHIKDGQDFFNYIPDENYDMIITNPPYSLKTKFLHRAYDIGKPFMFLLPLTALEGKDRVNLFSKYGIQLIIPSKRFNFITNKKSGAWFQTSWFTYGLNLEHELNFVNVP